jgi:hypothetical protein
MYLLPAATNHPPPVDAFWGVNRAEKGAIVAAIADLIFENKPLVFAFRRRCQNHYRVGLDP